MSKYAFLIHGDDAEFSEINPRLRMRKYGSWLIHEKIKQEEANKDRSRQILDVVQLAQKIAKDKGITVDQAFVAINNAEAEGNTAITADYLDEVRQIVINTPSEVAQDLMFLTYFVQGRGQGLIDGTWTDLKDWSDDDTKVLDDKTRNAIVAFINAEQSGGSVITDNGDDEDGAEPEDAEGNAGKPKTSGQKSRSSASEQSSTATTGTAATQESPLVA